MEIKIQHDKPYPIIVAGGYRVRHSYHKVEVETYSTIPDAICDIAKRHGAGVYKAFHGDKLVLSLTMVWY